MMYSSPGQPLSGSRVPYGGPQPPGGSQYGGQPFPPSGSQYGGPQPPSGGSQYGPPPPSGASQYGGPPPPSGGSQYGGPPPPSGGSQYGGPSGGNYGAPSSGVYRPPQPQPPTHQMSGMSLQQPGTAPHPRGTSQYQQPSSGQPSQQIFRPPPPPSSSSSSYHPHPTNEGHSGGYNQPQPPNFPPPPSTGQAPQSNFRPPALSAPQTDFGPVSVSGQTGFRPPLTMTQMSGGSGPPTSGQAVMGYGPPQGSGQHLGQPPPTSGQHPTGHGPSQTTGQSLGQPLPTSGQSPFVQTSSQPQGPPPSTSGQPLGPPPPSSGQPLGPPPPSSGQPLGPPPSSGQPLGLPPPTSGQPSMGYGTPPVSGQPTSQSTPPGGYTLSGQPLGQPQPISGQQPPMGYNQPSGQHPMYGQPPPGSGHGPPPSGQFVSGQTQSGQPQMMPPPHGMGMQPRPPQSGPTFPGAGPPSQYPGSMPPRGPGGNPMMPPPGSPGGPMGNTMTAPPPGGLQPQQRTRIDPDQMPNPVAMMKLDQDQRGPTPFHTSVRGIPPPLVTTNFTVVDDGISSPRFVRATVYNVPATRDLLNNCRVPLGLVVQPLATIPEHENTLHLVDHGATGPLRCNRCKTYMNPFARFVDGGRQYICPICQCSNEVPPEYFCHLDHKGTRTDIMSRPELLYGSVEYTATVDYCKDGRLPKAPAYIFLIDVSAGSVNSGLLPLLSQSMLSVFDNLPDANQEGGSPILVGLATYDKVLHFYNLNPSLAQPGMMVVADTADVFVPMVNGFLVNAKEARGVMESLLSQLPEMFSGVRPSELLLEPAVRAGLEALKAAQRNGRLFLFHTGLPSAQAPGQLKNRLDSKLLGTDKEKVLLQPVNSPYKKLAEECVKHGVGVELFLTPLTYCDVATLGELCSTTGGQLHLFPNYKAATDGSRLVSELTHCVARHTGFDAVMRVRASTGLRPTGFYGAFFMQNTTDIELGNIDADKAIAVEIKHDDKLKEEDIAFFQAALLYTTYKGERRLRIHNIALNCTTKYQDIYRSCEIDTIVNFFSKSLVNASLSLPFKTIRDSFTNQVAVMLACYRKQCSSQSSAGQLILPDSLKLLPMYGNCMLKSDCLLSPPILSLDEKCWLMYNVLSMSLEQSGPFFYPRIISLHDVDIEEKGLPPVLRCTGQKLRDTGVYVIENGIQLLLWVGQQVSHDFISQVFEAPSPAQINTDMASLPALDNPLSFRVRNICRELQDTRKLQMKVKVVKQRDPSEVLFRRMLKEDKGSGQWEGTSYIDFLCQIHRDVKELLN